MMLRPKKAPDTAIEKQPPAILTPNSSPPFGGPSYFRTRSQGMSQQAANRAKANNPMDRHD
tara:strand:- start:5012 stop:5194 length:183 start_codon:yes stop_codon:yes gene_type:complete